MEFGTAALGLTGAEGVRALARVMDDDDGERASRFGPGRSAAIHIDSSRNWRPPAIRRMPSIRRRRQSTVGERSESRNPMYQANFDRGPQHGKNGPEE